LIKTINSRTKCPIWDARWSSFS